MNFPNRLFASRTVCFDSGDCPFLSPPSPWGKGRGGGRNLVFFQEKAGGAGLGQRCGKGGRGGEAGLGGWDSNEWRDRLTLLSLFKKNADFSYLERDFQMRITRYYSTKSESRAKGSRENWNQKEGIPVAQSRCWIGIGKSAPSRCSITKPPPMAVVIYSFREIRVPDLPSGAVTKKKTCKRRIPERIDARGIAGQGSKTT